MKGEKQNMNKLFTKIAKIFLGLSMAAGVGVAISTVNGKKVISTHAGTENVSLSSVASANSWTNESQHSSWSFNSDITISTAGTGNNGKYYTSNSSWRLYEANSGALTITGVDGVTLSSVTFTYTAGNNGRIYKGSTKYASGSAITISGSSYSFDGVTHNSGTKSGNVQITAVSITYTKAASKTVSSISVADNSGKSWYAGDTVAASDLTVTVNYSSGDPAVITNGTGVYFNSTHTQTTSAALAQGSNTVTVYYTDTYGSASNSVSISAAAAVSLSSIAITTAPTKTTYNEGEFFDTTGMVVTATYSDSNTANVTTSCTFTPSTSTALSTSDKSVTVSYTYKGVEKTASQTIKVNPITTVSFIYGTDNSTGSTMTKGGATLTIGTPGTDGTFDINNNNCYKVYKNKTLVVSSSRNIASIEFTCTASGDAQYGPGCFTASVGSYVYSGYVGTWTGSATSVTFTASTNQTRPTQIVITYESTDPSVSLDPSSATSVSMLKGDSDTSVKVLVKNIDSLTWSFTYDEDEDEGLTTSSYINVSASALVSNVSTLTITTKAVGSTTIHISVSGTSCEATVPVTVAAKPAVGTLVAKLNSAVVSSAVECVTGSHVAFTFEAEDTDGNPYSVNAAALKLTISSGSSYGTAYGTTGINGVAQGTVVARFALKVLETVYVDVTVNVIDDYIETVGTPTFTTGLTDTQGQSPTVSVFTARPGTMHSGTATTIPFENYKFGYTNSYAASEYGSVFSYDFNHGTTVDPTHKLQTIYVFCDIDEAAHGSYTVTVEQLDDPLQTITFTDPANHALSITRGGSYQLEWEYSPANPTDGKEVEFVVDTNANNIDISVSSTGLVSIGSTSNLGTALVLIQSAHDDTIQDYVNITATLETMKYTIREAESLTPSATVSSGDRVYMVATATDHSNQTYEFNGYPGTYGGATQYTTNIAKLQLLVVEAGTESGTVAFKLSGGDNDGEYINYSGSSNTLNHTSTKDKSASWTVSGTTITNANTTARQIWLNWNNGTPRFACYTNKESTTGYYCPTFIKVTGGDSEMDVTPTLFNGVHDNFGEGKTYEWDASCSNFDEDAWFDACDGLTSIASYSSYKLERALGNMSGNEIEVFLAKYDIIIGKVGTDNDWLGRFGEGGINHGAKVGISPLANIIGYNTNTVAIIVIISMVSVTAIGGYFFLRRRKENI